MRLYAAIDLKDGKCVRLVKGNMAAATIYNDNAVAQAFAFQKMGFPFLHVIDLNGALNGNSVNRPIVERILKEVKLPIQLGGGIRDRASAETWLEAGVSRIILGTTAITNPQLVRDLARAHPGRIVLGIDALGGLVATEGWVKNSDMKALHLAKQFADAGIAAIVHTDIGQDGTLTGPNIADTVKMAELVQIPIILSGGIATLDHVREVIDAKVIEGVLLGRALYERTLDVHQALSLANRATMNVHESTKNDDVW